jgi:hypothetical protein
VFLLLVTLITAQDFYRAEYDSALALKTWWVDAPFHIVKIDSVANFIEGGNLTGYAVAGDSSSLYHFLGYVPAAIACVLFDLAPIEAFALVYAPLGLLLFALGIWLMAATIWSREHALWATLLFLLIPDVLVYVTTSHEFLRLKWLVSVSPGLGYGAFTCALAWVFCLKGVRESRPGYVAIGWLVCVLTVLVKAHLFVANALPLVAYTIASYPNLERSKRGLLLILFICVYTASVLYAANFPGIPLIRLDFSNAAAYADTLASFTPMDVISPWLLNQTTASPVYIAPLILGVTLLFLHFGGSLLLTLILLRNDQKRGELRRWLPALAVFMFYMLHAVGLAQDSREYTYTGEPMELIHRPFVWGVSLIMVWTFASLAANHPKFLTIGRRWFLLGLMLPVAILSYKGMQFSPEWNAPSVDYSDAYLEAMHFVERRATHGELVQAADLDPFLAVQAVTRHKPYVAKYMMHLYPPAIVLDRSEEVRQWLRETDAVRIEAMAEEMQIDWLLLLQSSDVNWPSSIIEQHTRFVKDNVVVMQFSPQ